MLREIFGRFPPVYRQLNRVRRYRLTEPTTHISFALLGTTYGAWTVPEGYLKSDSIVYSVGLGEDISFDYEIIDRFGCRVHGFDPTPIAKTWLMNQDLSPKFTFHDVGLAEFDGDVDFFFPPEGHSFSRETLSAQKSVSRPVRRLSSLMKELGHEQLDLLKMDIEGFEYAVIDDMILSGIKPRILNVEFHHKSYGYKARDTISAIDKLTDYGYENYWVSDLGREYGFVYRGD